MIFCGFRSIAVNSVYCSVFTFMVVYADRNEIWHGRVCDVFSLGE